MYKLLSFLTFFLILITTNSLVYADLSTYPKIDFYIYKDGKSIEEEVEMISLECVGEKEIPAEQCTNFQLKTSEFGQYKVTPKCTDQGNCYIFRPIGVSENFDIVLKGLKYRVQNPSAFQSGASFQINVKDGVAYAKKDFSHIFKIFGIAGITFSIAVGITVVLELIPFLLIIGKPKQNFRKFILKFTLINMFTMVFVWISYSSLDLRFLVASEILATAIESKLYGIIIKATDLNATKKKIIIATIVANLVSFILPIVVIALIFRLF